MCRGFINKKKMNMRRLLRVIVKIGGKLGDFDVIKVK